MSDPGDSSEETRTNALTAFLEARVREGFRIETRTDTHAIIAQAERRLSFLRRLFRPGAPGRQVISVDEHGEVTASPAEPLRS
jgi:hypothetical protein